MQFLALKMYLRVKDTSKGQGQGQVVSKGKVTKAVCLPSSIQFKHLVTGCWNQVTLGYAIKLYHLTVSKEMLQELNSCGYTSYISYSNHQH